jgi:nucleotide-binding universal stress UspA family protein
VTSLQRDEAGLIAAAALARAFTSRLTVLMIAVHPGSEYLPVAAPLSEVLEDIAKGARGAAAVEREKVRAWLERAEVAFELRDVIVDTAVRQREILAHARHADVSVMTRPGPLARVQEPILHALLFQSGRPVIVVPPEQRRELACARILVAWKPTREAVRAVNDAMPFLGAAQNVVIATVDAQPSPSGHGQAPGWDLAAQLARRGVRAEVRNLDSAGRSDARALLDEAVGIDADMIVLGGYGHARAMEYLLGGVTRELLTGSTIPLFLSH